MTPFHGVVVPTVTLFREDGSLDGDANAALIERMIQAGVDGILVLGTTGEAQHLTVEEREEIIRWAAGQVSGRATLYAGVGDTCTAVTYRLLRAAESAGVDAAVAVAPYFWTLNDRQLYRHFSSLAASTSLPLLLYNYPSYVGANLSMELVCDLAESCPNIVGIKESLDSGTHMRQVSVHARAIRQDFAVFCGHDDLSLFALSAGLDGMVSSTVNFAPEVVLGVWRRYHAGDFEEAVRLSRILGRLIEAYALDPSGAAVVKAAMHLRGWIPNASPRPPALPLEPVALHSLRRILDRAGLMNDRGADVVSP